MNKNIPTVTIVNYNNTKPLLLGLEKAASKGFINLDYDFPARVAEDLSFGKCDIGLIPVAAIPNIPNARIICDYGIATEGSVSSVCIFSNVPIADITHLYLDYQSRTSIALAQLIMEEYLNRDIKYLHAREGYIKNISGTTAGVIIGDRALKALGHYEYVYDLGTLWRNWTGLPFVFAAWVSPKEFSQHFIEDFNNWNAEGVNNIDQIIKKVEMDYYDPSVYFKENIKYELGEKEKEGLRLFLQKINPNFNLNFES